MANDPYKAYRRRIEASLNRIERNTAGSEAQPSSPPPKRPPLLGIGAFALSLVAVVVSISIYLLELSQAQKNDAQSMYAEYVSLAIAHPEFSNGLEHQELSCSEEDQACMELKSRYDWYLSFTLFALEKVIIAFPDDHEGWLRLAKDQLCYHRNAIFGTETLFRRDHYGTKLTDFVDGMRANDCCPAETSFPAQPEEITNPDPDIIDPCPVHSTCFVDARRSPEG